MRKFTSCVVLITVVLTSLFHTVNAQSTSFFSNDSILNKIRLTGVIASQSLLYTGSVVALNELWYKDYPRSSFHLFNDNTEWLQMDKAGHGVASYNISLYSSQLLRWSGLSHNKSAWYGSITGFVYLGTIEMLDGFSTAWGFSWGDIAANTIGAATFSAQEIIWKEQRMRLKFSAVPSKYAQYRPSVLGASFSQQLLKDYNAQTYWLSVNVSSFMSKDSRFPKWLNIAIGYGADGMVGATDNPTFTEFNGSMVSFDRYRQYYLSLDIDLTRVKTKNAFLKALANTIGFVKFPFPALELNKYGLRVDWLGF